MKRIRGRGSWKVEEFTFNGISELRAMDRTGFKTSRLGGKATRRVQKASWKEGKTTLLGRKGGGAVYA